MAITRFSEKPLSQESTGSPPSVVYHYTCYSSTDFAEVQAFAYEATASAITSPYGVLYRQDIRCEPEGSDQWHVMVPYAKEQRAVGSFRLSFDTTGGTFNRKVSISTAAKYAAAGEDAPADYKGAIDVQDDGTVNGCDVIIPALKLNCHFKHPAGFVTGNQLRAVARLTGCKNSATFLGYQPGEVLLLGMTGQEGTDTETEVAYQFACSENLVDATIGPFTHVNKQGHDYAWVKFKKDVDDGNPVIQPKALYIEQVYFAKNFGAILGFGS